MKNIIRHDDKNLIDALCEEFSITNYTINPDGSIDVEGNVDLSEHEIYNTLPLRFGKVSGYFDCSENFLTSLEGCPISVGGTFDCNHNEIVSLEGCPISVGRNFYCYDNELTSLVFCPSEILDSIDCSHNRLTTLEGGPTSISGDFNCMHNQLTTLKHSPKSTRDLDCSYNNQLTSLDGCPTIISGSFYVESTSLPNAFNNAYINSKLEERDIIIKYQHDYEVWYPEFNEDNMNDLIADIKDGLL